MLPSYQYATAKGRKTPRGGGRGGSVGALPAVLGLLLLASAALHYKQHANGARLSASLEDALARAERANAAAKAAQESARREALAADEKLHRVQDELATVTAESKAKLGAVDEAALRKEVTTLSEGAAKSEKRERLASESMAALNAEVAALRSENKALQARVKIAGAQAAARQAAKAGAGAADDVEAELERAAADAEEAAGELQRIASGVGAGTAGARADRGGRAQRGVPSEEDLGDTFGEHEVSAGDL